MLGKSFSQIIMQHRNTLSREAVDLHLWRVKPQLAKPTGELI